MSSSPIESARKAHQAHAAQQFAKLREVLRVVAVSMIVAIGLRSFLYEPFSIPSESMLPTLHGGDYLFVAKWPYGYGRFSLPLGLPLFGERVAENLPERGDVIVFKSPRDNRTDFIKRVIGLPGDRVRVTDGQIELNGQLIPKLRTADLLMTIPAADGKTRDRTPCYIETVGGRRFGVLDEVSDDIRDDTPLVVVPAGHLWVLGDNRDDSADSRLSIADGGVGMVPVENLIGRADRIFFSLDGTARLLDPVSWVTAIRTDRIGAAL